MANKAPKTGASRAAKRGRLESHPRKRKRDRLAELDPFASLAPLGERRIVKAISESTEDFTTGRYEP
jgi:hypothetical protein